MCSLYFKSMTFCHICLNSYYNSSVLPEQNEPYSSCCMPQARRPNTTTNQTEGVTAKVCIAAVAKIRLVTVVMLA